MVWPLLSAPTANRCTTKAKVAHRATLKLSTWRQSTGCGSSCGQSLRPNGSPSKSGMHHHATRRSWRPSRAKSDHVPSATLPMLCCVVQVLNGSTLAKQKSLAKGFFQVGHHLGDAIHVVAVGKSDLASPFNCSLPPRACRRNSAVIKTCLQLGSCSISPPKTGAGGTAPLRHFFSPPCPPQPDVAPYLLGKHHLWKLFDVQVQLNGKKSPPGAWEPSTCPWSPPSSYPPSCDAPAFEAASELRPRENSSGWAPKAGHPSQRPWQPSKAERNTLTPLSGPLGCTLPMPKTDRAWINSPTKLVFLPSSWFIRS